MEKFLEIVFDSQILDTKKGEVYLNMYEPMLKKLKDTLSGKMYEEIEEIFTDCSICSSKYYAVEGMKLAIGIMDGSYIPIL